VIFAIKWRIQLSGSRVSHHICVGDLLGWGPWGQFLSVKSISIIFLLKNVKSSRNVEEEREVK